MVTNLFELEAQARQRLSALPFDYFYGGAGDEVTLRENRAAFDRIALRPRALAGVGRRDTATTVLGRRHPGPIIVAPTAFATLAHPDGELAIARAAAGMGITITLSTLASCSIEEIAQVNGPRWFQVYVFKDRTITEALVHRAEAAGYEALMLTVDAPLLGRRERDLRNRFQIPADMTAKNLAAAGLDRLPAGSDSGLATYFASLLDPSLTWDDLDWLRAHTRLPVFVKGVLRADDAALAVSHGASGVIVSNHGGRQLDTAIPAIRALPEIADAVAGRADVLMDSGVRRGTDIVKALALGASAVLVGRPILWGLAVDGEAGVRAALSLLAAEFDLAMALCGCATTAQITPDLLAP